MTGGRQAAAALAAICCAAFAARFLPARLSPNLVWPDEVFQSTEQAHRLVHGNGVVPWEFREGTRSWLLPGLLAGVMVVTGFASEGSSGYLDGIAAFLSALSLVTVVAAFVNARRRGFGLAEAAAAAVVCGAWFELAYFGPKALTEVVAAHALIAGMLLADARDAGRGRLVAAGACLGLSVVLRMHLGPAVLVAGAWLGFRPPRRGIGLLLGAAIPVVLAGLVDLACWGAPFASYVNNLRSNVLEARSESYGVAGPGAYLGVLARTWWAGAVFVLPAAALGAARRPAWAATAAVVLLAHSVMAHKEYRFIYPAVAIVFVLAAEGTAEAVARVRARLGTRGARVAAVAASVAWVALSGGLASRFAPHLTNLTSLPQPASSHWTRLTGVLSGMELLSSDHSVCGVGVAVPWFATGGYTYLHQDIPLHEIGGARELRRVAPAVNAIIVHEADVNGAPGYAVERCFSDGMCVLRRGGGCEPVPGYDLNAVLRERGQ